MSMLHAMSMLHSHVHAACPCPCCMPTSILHAYNHVSCLCPCLCCVPMSMLRAHVCLCICCMFVSPYWGPCCRCTVYVHAMCPFYVSMLRFRSVCHDACPCSPCPCLDCMPMSMLDSAWICSEDMQHEQVAWTCIMDRDFQIGQGHAAWTWACSFDLGNHDAWTCCMIMLHENMLHDMLLEWKLCKNENRNVYGCIQHGHGKDKGMNKDKDMDMDMYTTSGGKRTSELYNVQGFTVLITDLRITGCQTTHGTKFLWMEPVC
jgi:hypothetical protein